jgi:uncharacterized protein (DUF58 family)
MANGTTLGSGSRAPRGGRVAAMRFVDPHVLARIGNLDLVSRMLVDGFISGLHDAVFRGVSVDFAEHRPYVPGDDVRRVDWRLFARTDRLYVKTFEAETNADIVFALDLSRSMDFTSHALTKLDYGRFVVGCLAHLAGRQRDRIGLVGFDSDIVEMLPPSGRRRELLMRALAGLPVRGVGDTCAALRMLARRLTRRGIVVVVSDFYAEPDALAAAFDELRLRGQDVIALHLLDPAERDLGHPDPVVLEDLESRTRVPVVPAAIRDDYRAQLAAHQQALEQVLGARRIDYAAFDTDRPLDHLLYHYLSTRAYRARVRR